jgi:hypothetical protein
LNIQIPNKWKGRKTKYNRGIKQMLTLQTSHSLRDKGHTFLLIIWKSWYQKDTIFLGPRGNAARSSDLAKCSLNAK